MDVPPILTTDNTVLVLIDIQERLFPVMNEKEKLLRNILKLIQGAKVLEIPIVLTEQYPKGLGPTLPEIMEMRLMMINGLRWTPAINWISKVIHSISTLRKP